MVKKGQAQGKTLVVEPSDRRSTGLQELWTVQTVSRE